MATDNFNRADGGLGANWTTGHGDAPQITSNQAGGADTEYSMAFWNADAFTDDQYSQLVRVNNENYRAPAVRCDATSGGNCYAAFSNATQWHKLVNGTWSQLGNISNTALNDVIRLEVVGTGLDYQINGSSANTTTDASLTEGAAGMAFFGATSRVDDWEGGDLGVAGGFIAFPHPRGLSGGMHRLSGGMQ